jgi:C4-dicarboxylate-specific signal transduction histidine kinase
MSSERSSIEGPKTGPPDEVALRHARTELERAARMALAGELVAAITHDLRQPLQAVEMNVAAALYLLRADAQAPSEAIAALVDAQEQQRRMSDALQVLQDLAVRREPFFEAVDAVSIVREVVRLVGTDALARHVPIGLEIVPPIPRVFGDAVLMHQALLNVLLDALEATSRSGQPSALVRVGIRREDSNVVITVSHVGAQLERPTVEEWGLAVARSVVATHQGSVTTDSNAEHGISVETRWPIAPISALAAAQEVTS